MRMYVYFFSKRRLARGPRGLTVQAVFLHLASVLRATRRNVKRTGPVVTAAAQYEAIVRYAHVIIHLLLEQECIINLFMT
jgi:hypothetical protein